jgi:hypothetical protein
MVKSIKNLKKKVKNRYENQTTKSETTSTRWFDCSIEFLEWIREFALA